jgi:hypothetical protein
MATFYAVVGIGNLEEKLRDREIAKIGSRCRCVSSVGGMGVRAVPTTSIKVLLVLFHYGKKTRNGPIPSYFRSCCTCKPIRYISVSCMCFSLCFKAQICNVCYCGIIYLPLSRISHLEF